MKFSSSTAGKASPKVRTINSRSGSPTQLPPWLTENADIKLYIVYAVAVVLMLAFYFLDMPPERWEFYRHSMSAWSAWFGS